MTHSEKTQFLKELLAKHKGKENKNYLTWEALRADLGKDGLKKFNLTAKAAWKKLKDAIEPHCDAGMMFSEHFGQWYFSDGITPDELKAILIAEKGPEKINFLQALLTKAKKNYHKLTAADIKKIALSPAEFGKLLTAYPGAGLRLFTKKKGKTDVLYLTAAVPPEQFVVDAINGMKKAVTPKAIAEEVPLSNADFVATFNGMLVAGQLLVRIDEKFAISDVSVGDAITSSESTETDYELFRKAFDKLEQGRNYVRICNMRRELSSWSRERFDAVLSKLWYNGTVQPHAGDRATMTEDDVKLSYTDEHNDTYDTLKWVRR